MRTLSFAAVAVVLFALTACGNGGGHHERDAFPFPVKVTAVPVKYQDSTCAAQAITNESQVVLACSSPARKCLFVRWDGGEGFTELPSPTTTGLCGLQSYGENGAYIATTFEERSVGDAVEVNLTTVMFDGKEFRNLPNGKAATISQLSRNGRFAVGYLFEGVKDPQISLFDNFVPFPLVSTEPDVTLVDAFSVNGSGQVVGSANVGQSANSFSTQVGYRLSGTRLELLSPLGRPELNTVNGMGINDRGDVIGLSSTDTIVSGSDRSGPLSAQSQVYRTVLYSADGRTINVGPEESQIGTFPGGINNNGTVYGIFVDPRGDGSDGQGSFVFSERSGFFKLFDVVPSELRDPNFSIIGLNDKNELLLSSLVGEPGPVIVSLPASF